jgi:glucose-1-phosphate cytidylyltransferase
MKVVILCGGKGTRLREETEYRPKPMVPIGSRPILWHIMKIYAAYGHTDFILCLGYKGEVIKDWFRNLRWMTSDVRLTLGAAIEPHFFGESEEQGWNVTLADTGQESMTGGRLKRIEKYLGDDKEFLFTYGDGVGSINVNALIDFHREQNRVLTLTGVRPPGRWGEIDVTDGLVTNFFEKPQTSNGHINGGFFVAKRELFSYLNDDPMLIFEQGPLSSMSRDSQLACYRHEGFWQPMDTYQEFMLLNRLWNEGKADWKIW